MEIPDPFHKDLYITLGLTPLDEWFENIRTSLLQEETKEIPSATSFRQTGGTTWCLVRCLWHLTQGHVVSLDFDTEQARYRAVAKVGEMATSMNLSTTSKNKHSISFSNRARVLTRVQRGQTIDVSLNDLEFAALAERYIRGGVDLIQRAIFVGPHYECYGPHGEFLFLTDLNEMISKAAAQRRIEIVFSESKHSE